MDLRTFLNFAAVIGAAQRNARVARVMPTTGDVVYGTARRITGASHSSVKDQSLEVTADPGWEVSWPLAVLAEEVGRGDFVVDPAE